MAKSFLLSKLIIYCLLIVSEVVVVIVMFRHGIGLRDLEYGHALYVLINNQYACNMHANKVNSEKCSLI